MQWEIISIKSSKRRNVSIYIRVIINFQHIKTKYLDRSMKNHSFEVKIELFLQNISEISAR